tara:strand:- start:4481 stop:5086 length:606 start_codon:yes stop_codon:yes gene_type:complete
MIEYYHPFFGPFLMQTKITNEEVAAIKKLCVKSKKLDFRKKLAGVIEHEYTINRKEYQKIIKEYLDCYKHGYQKFHNNTLGPLTCNSAWVNYMVAGESNPPHTHSSCHFSSVLYLDTPPGLIKENKDYLGSSEGPGAIIFRYGEQRMHNITEHAHLPESGDLFIFPFNLMHYVVPFKSKGERISVAANFTTDLTLSKGVIE